MRIIGIMLIIGVAGEIIAQPANNTESSEVDELAGFRGSAVVQANCDAILSGGFAYPNVNRVTIYAVDSKQGKCTRSGVVFESKSADEIKSIVELLKDDEDQDAKLAIVVSGHKDLVIAFFQEDIPTAWFLIRRGYDQIHAYREKLFPDGKWVITGGRTFNQFEAWLQKRKLSFPDRTK